MCEFLPLPENRVILSDERDRHGLPVAHFNYPRCENDKALMRAAQLVMEDILHAAGADEVITIDRYAHLVGGARMGADERHGVVDGDCRSFAVPNLYITDGSVLPTEGSSNPSLTIMAVAARAADRLTRMIDPMVDSVDVSVFTISTDAPEADGTIAWESTTMIPVRITVGGTTGMGWTYGAAACGQMVSDVLARSLRAAAPSISADVSLVSFIRGQRPMWDPSDCGRITCRPSRQRILYQDGTAGDGGLQLLT